MNIASHRGFEVGVAPRRTAFLRFVIAALAAATDAAAIVLISMGTGILYHKFLYGDVGPIPLFVQTGLVTAWLYVVIRIVHSLVQATVNVIMIRFAIFMIGSLVLMALAFHAAIATGLAWFNLPH